MKDIAEDSSIIGETAAELLLRSIDAKTPLRPERILIRPHLIVRDSTRRR